MFGHQPFSRWYVASQIYSMLICFTFNIIVSGNQDGIHQIWHHNETQLWCHHFMTSHWMINCFQWHNIEGHYLPFMTSRFGGMIWNTEHCYIINGETWLIEMGCNLKYLPTTNTLMYHNNIPYTSCGTYRTLQHK